jgi:prephenate dehydratase
MNKSDHSTDTTSAAAPSASQPPLRVGIQGYAGAFHELAARRFFGDRPLEIVPAHTFDQLVSTLETGQTMDTSLMAIENTLAGTLLANYLLLTQSSLSITGEVFLHIQQNLLVQPGVAIEDLREVHSHPIAIAQCREFFDQYPHIHLVETADTALSAREVSEKGWRHIGAIASTLAAELYGLEVLAESIETNKLNHTRFLVLERSNQTLFSRGADKVSLSFTVDHQVGSLYKVLAVLAAYNVNLTKIQSAPIIGRPWEYQFFVDFVVDGNVSWEQSIDAIGPITRQLKVLGAYPQGEKV